MATPQPLPSLFLSGTSGALAMPLLRRFEACRLSAYPDPASGGDPYAVGWGATGAGIVRGTIWTQQEADDDLERRVMDLAAEVLALLKFPLPNLSRAALISFAYNLGIHALSESTLLRLINAGHPRPAADEFLKWTHASGRVFPGLVTRRTQERAVFLSGLDGGGSVAGTASSIGAVGIGVYPTGGAA